MRLGNELRHLRKLRRLTLLEVSEQTGLSVSFLSDIERGRTNPSLESLEKLAGCYGVSFNEIFEDAKFGQSQDLKIYPPGFEAFLETMPDVDEEMRELILRVEHRAQRRSETKEDWIQLYYSLKTLLGR